MEKRVSCLKQSVDEVNTKTSIVEKIKFLCNSEEKKAVLFFLLLALPLSVADVDVFFYKTPSFKELSISEGIFTITHSGRGGSLTNLKVNHMETLHFTCAIVDSQLANCIDDYDKIIGKKGKIWWKLSYHFGWSKEKLVYQIEVEDKIIISYQSQVKKYMNDKFSFPINIAFFVFLFFCFIKFQFKK